MRSAKGIANFWKVLLTALPWLFLAFYFWHVFTYYAYYLDGSLKFTLQAGRSAPEDILGFGFWHQMAH